MLVSSYKRVMSLYCILLAIATPNKKNNAALDALPQQHHDHHLVQAAPRAKQHCLTALEHDSHHCGDSATLFGVLLPPTPRRDLTPQHEAMAATERCDWSDDSMNLLVRNLVERGGAHLESNMAMQRAWIEAIDKSETTERHTDTST